MIDKIKAAFQVAFSLLKILCVALKNHSLHPSKLSKQNSKMRYILLLFFTVFFAAQNANAQTYEDSLQAYHTKYKMDFLTEPNSPLKASDTGFIHFYAPDKNYCVEAVFKATPDAKTFKMETHSGKVKDYRQYGVLQFTLMGKTCSLEVYQSIALMKNEKLKNYLFVPFNDATNYETTYAGGRYLDLSIQDIVNNKVILDFNKCYNPYCAYASGYSCPIPPKANKLAIKIEAGEKNFTKPE